MDEHDLAGPFEESRPHLNAVAYRMLGSRTEAEDAVQEAWLRLSRADTSEVGNIKGWLTTVVARVCLDMLRSRTSRREESLEAHASGPSAPHDAGDAEQEAVLADSIGLALLVVLESLAPSERVAFVLHDMFDLPFDEIATIVGKSPAAARQLASRARRRVQGAGPGPAVDRTRQHEIVSAFLAASRGGDFVALLTLLDPNAVFRPDMTVPPQPGTPGEAHGATAVAKTFVGRARAARLARIDGEPGLVWAPGGDPRVVFAFTIVDDRIVAIDLVANPERLGQLDLEILGREEGPAPA